MFRKYDNTIVFKSFQVYPIIDINFVKKKLKSPTVGDLKRLLTVAFAKTPTIVKYCRNAAVLKFIALYLSIRINKNE